MTVQEKLEKELLELTEALHKLEVFNSIEADANIEYRKVSDYHLQLLRDQEYYMAEYAKVLRLRIADLK